MLRRFLRGERSFVVVVRLVVLNTGACLSAEELPQPTLHLRVPTPADTGGLVPHPAGVQAGLSAQDVAALAAAEVSTVGLVRPAVTRGQLA